MICIARFLLDLKTLRRVCILASVKICHFVFYNLKCSGSSRLTHKIFTLDVENTLRDKHVAHEIPATAISKTANSEFFRLIVLTGQCLIQSREKK